MSDGLGKGSTFVVRLPLAELERGVAPLAEDGTGEDRLQILLS